ncbi:hypothetical protein N9924_00605 [bacterium]|nr:hypothetical protein [bacterium]
MNIKAHTCTTDNGDGSSSIHYFKTKEDAQAYSDYEENEYGIPGEVDEDNFQVVDGVLKPLGGWSEVDNDE